MELAVADDGWEGLLLDRGRAQVDAVEDRGVEDVDAGVDAIAHKLDGLLDEAVDSRRVVRFVDDDTVLGRLLYFSYHDGSLVAMGLVEGSQLGEGVIAGDIGVEDEEGSLILAEDLLGEFQGTGSAEGFGLDGEGDVDSESLLVLEAKR